MKEELEKVIEELKNSGEKIRKIKNDDYALLVKGELLQEFTSAMQYIHYSTSKLKRIVVQLEVANED